MKKRIFGKVGVLVALFMVALPILVLAQPGFGGGDVDDTVPLDGGLSLLVVAGVGYGAKKISEKRKRAQKKAEDDAGEIK
jgi:hypothetical protein